MARMCQWCKVPMKPIFMDKKDMVAGKSVIKGYICTKCDAPSQKK